MSRSFIPIDTPLLTGNEKKYLNECIDSGWISGEGEFVTRFENNFSAYTGRKYGIAVANGSGALDVAIQALGIGPGDEVIMPAFTIISPAFSIVRAGARPVLVDSDPVTWNVNVNEIESKITPRTKAILVVHIYGLPVDMDPVLALCRKYNLRLVEDAAEMHGQTYKGKMCGSFGDVSVFSFYSNKHVTTGEGGMILTDDEALFIHCRKLRNLSFEPLGRRFLHNEMGWNYRMSNLQAALGVAQLETIDERLAKKRRIGHLYAKELRHVNGFQLPLEHTGYAENIYWVFGLVAESEEKCAYTLHRLNEAGIGTRPFFWCMHEQPVFRNMGLFIDEHYPNAEKLSRNGFYLPSGSGMKEEDVAYVIDNLKNIEL